MKALLQVYAGNAKATNLDTGPLSFYAEKIIPLIILSPTVISHCIYKSSSLYKNKRRIFLALQIPEVIQWNKKKKLCQ